MTTPCPHCVTQIEIDAESRAALRDHTHFACPACQGLVPVPTLAKPQMQLNPAPGTRATAMAPPAHRPQKAATASRKTNRNMLILGATALLVLGGLAFFLAQRRSANTNTSTQNIRNEIINNSYFQNLIASGKTTMRDLEAVATIRPYQDGFIGISRDSLPWNQSTEVARRAGALVLDVGFTDTKDRTDLTNWLRETLLGQLDAVVWILDGGQTRIFDGAEILAVNRLDGPRKVLLQWNCGAGIETPDPYIAKFSGTKWRNQYGFDAEFNAAGCFAENFFGNVRLTGTWKALSNTEIEVNRSDNTVWHFLL